MQFAQDIKAVLLQRVLSGEGVSCISKSSLCPSVANLKLMVPEQAEDAALSQHTEGAEGAFKVVTFFLFLAFYMRVVLQHFKHCASPQGISKFVEMSHVKTNPKNFLDSIISC